ncbi:permease [Clostridium sp.]|jgi:ABC-2 type transport system permease protein|uniref:putative ABC transporter permease subunit n=1 Tax=Clostridium sp. TaxID=1506 RepID=UPI0025835D08|nr:permease [Clostridium sp.]MDF2502675.1 putative permease [Clostridium sp.]
MNKLFILTKILLKNSDNPFESGFNNKKKLGMIILLILCFLPLAFMFGGSTIASYDILAKLNLQGMLLTSTITFSCVAMIVFGFFYIMSIFYFSKDIDTLIPLPLKPYEILGAKLVIVMLFQYFVELITLLPTLIGFGYKAGNIIFAIYSIIIFLTLPIIPIIICGLISIIIMAFTDIVKDKDRFKFLSGMFGIIFAVLINIFIRKINGPNSFITSIKDNSSTINNATNAFPTAKLAAFSLLNSNSVNGLLNILLFLIISIAALIIFVVAAQGLYFKGAIGMSESTSKGKKLSDKELNKSSVQSSKLKSYTIKELKLLIRTPAYLQNCVIGGVILPPIMLLIILFSNGGLSKSFNFPMNHIFLVIASTVLIATTSFNLICPTAISREGDGIFILHYLPVSYKTQILAKVILGIIISIIADILMLIIGAIIFKISILMLVMLIVISILGIIFYSFLGIFIDLSFPKLDWDNEVKAVKQNFNGFLLIVFLIIIGAITIIPFIFLKLSLISTFIILIVVYSILSLLAYKLTMTKGIESLK